MMSGKSTDHDEGSPLSLKGTLHDDVNESDEAFRLTSGKRFSCHRTLRLAVDIYAARRNSLPWFLKNSTGISSHLQCHFCCGSIIGRTFEKNKGSKFVWISKCVLCKDECRGRALHVKNQRIIPPLRHYFDVDLIMKKKDIPWILRSARLSENKEPYKICKSTRAATTLHCPSENCRGSIYIVGTIKENVRGAMPPFRVVRHVPCDDVCRSTLIVRVNPEGIVSITFPNLPHHPGKTRRNSSPPPSPRPRPPSSPRPPRPPRPAPSGTEEEGWGNECVPSVDHDDHDDPPPPHHHDHDRHDHHPHSQCGSGRRQAAGERGTPPTPTPPTPTPEDDSRHPPSCHHHLEREGEAKEEEEDAAAAAAAAAGRNGSDQNQLTNDDDIKKEQQQQSEAGMASSSSSSSSSSSCSSSSSSSSSSSTVVKGQDGGREAQACHGPYDERPTKLPPAAGTVVGVHRRCRRRRRRRHEEVSAGAKGGSTSIQRAMSEISSSSSSPVSSSTLPPVLPLHPRKIKQGDVVPPSAATTPPLAAGPPTTRAAAPSPRHQEEKTDKRDVVATRNNVVTAPIALGSESSSSSSSSSSSDAAASSPLSPATTAPPPTPNPMECKSPSLMATTTTTTAAVTIPALQPSSSAVTMYRDHEMPTGEAFRVEEEGGSSPEQPRVKRRRFSSLEEGEGGEVVPETSRPFPAILSMFRSSQSSANWTDPPNQGHQQQLPPMPMPLSSLSSSQLDGCGDTLRHGAHRTEGTTSCMAMTTKTESLVPPPPDAATRHCHCRHHPPGSSISDACGDDDPSRPPPLLWCCRFCRGRQMPPSIFMRPTGGGDCVCGHRQHHVTECRTTPKTSRVSSVDADARTAHASAAAAAAAAATTDTAAAPPRRSTMMLSSSSSSSSLSRYPSLASSPPSPSCGSGSSLKSGAKTTPGIASTITSREAAQRGAHHDGSGHDDDVDGENSIIHRGSGMTTKTKTTLNLSASEFLVVPPGFRHLFNQSKSIERTTQCGRC